MFTWGLEFPLIVLELFFFQLCCVLYMSTQIIMIVARELLQMTFVPALLVNESGVAQAWSTDLNHQGVCDILTFFAIRS